jgi:UDP-N-acetylglucosamine 2-epimerase (non-hydrolysing)
LPTDRTDVHASIHILLRDRSEWNYDYAEASCLRKVAPLLVFGTRPEAIKMAPIVQACRDRGERVQATVCVTGQHREMLDGVMQHFGLGADVDLAAMTANQSLASLTARCMSGLDETIERFQPDCIVAQGDTITSMSAALAAFYRRVPFVHVEAGLRTGDLQSPWPEELNRRVASLAAAVHCAPTKRAADNLIAEGIDPARVHVTGNTVVDALLWTLDRERRHGEKWRTKYAFLADRLTVLITGHRRENFEGGLANLCQAVSQLALQFADVEFVYPVHLNPHVQRAARAALSERANIHLLAPVAYPEFVWLMDRSALIVTDSGGIQEEAPSLGKPVLVTREKTERPEALECGAIELVGTNIEAIVEGATRLLTNPATCRQEECRANPYGDGQAASRIVDLIANRAWIINAP